MWDYDKLFADGNIIGIKDPKGIIYKKISSLKERHAGSIRRFCNDSLSFNAVDGEHFINWIIQLDEYGNIIEKVFDRERDIPKNPMPNLEDGMFIRVEYNDYSEDTYHPDRKTTLGYVDMGRNRILYQNGHSAKIKNGKIELNYEDKIVEVYKDANSFGDCLDYCRTWRDEDYQHYLNLYGTN